VTHLRDASLTDQQIGARSDRARSLLDHPGYELVLAELAVRRVALEAKILDGELGFDEYHAYCGELKGIVYALEIPNRLIRQAPEGGPDV
jgi:hypothetical protein